ncbi:hypothetical protein N7493_002955 [Penicillium malachiteum]|uniref:SPRY domain-containing protein n=1 Tax=Penicillium malachiteum TaxID=1324776 RepID=A0AAD6MZ59_9EURO|nr:hypothetical protein N7493_002955 [Penicillium malachiteum]
MSKNTQFWGPPPSYEASSSDQGDPPPYHNWQEAVPDTSIFPPPPISGYYSSGTGNANIDDADRAHQFCDQTPLWIPSNPSEAVYSAVQYHDLRPVRQRDSGTGDADTSGFSIGFAAQPYPSWRSPGWERGSLGVFSDDGCRFVNDSWGGRDFTGPIHVGETVGLGMVFSLPEISGTKGGKKGKSPCRVQVFFTRNGHRAGEWDLHEEVDEDSGSIQGLEGDFDLYGAIGLFGGVHFESCFDPAGWLWQPTV